MCLTQFEHLDCGPLWSSVSHNTDPGPAGSLVVYPVSLMGQSGCHPHPEGWEVRTSSYWYTCALKVCVSVHVWHTVQLKSRGPAVFVECLPLCPLTPTPADRDHHPLTLFNSSENTFRWRCQCVWSISVCTSSCSSRGMRKANDWSQRWAVPRRRGSIGSQNGSLSLGNVTVDSPATS